MPASAQRERAGQVEIGVILILLAGVARGIAVQPEPRDRIGRAVHIEQCTVVAQVAVIDRAFQFPAVGESMIDLHERERIAGIPIGPVRGGVGRTRIIRRHAVRVIQRQSAPHGSARRILLPSEPCRQQRVRTEIRFDDAGNEPAAQRIAIQVTVAILIRRHQPAAHAAAVVQRPGQIEIETAIVPASNRQTDTALQVRRRFLAYEVDRGGRIAGERQQAIRATQHFDMVVDGGVDRAFLVAICERQTEPIHQEIGDIEAARAVEGAVRFDPLDVDTGGLLQHLIDVVHAEIVHLRARDDADRLRRLSQGQRQARGRGFRAGRIVAAAFGDQRIRFPGHGHALQLGDIARAAGFLQPVFVRADRGNRKAGTGQQLMQDTDGIGSRRNPSRVPVGRHKLQPF